MNEQKIAEIKEKYTFLKGVAVKDEPNTHTVWLVIGDQQFVLDSYWSKEEGEWQRDMLSKAILALISEREKPMVDLLKEAKCPNCDGSGIIPHQTSTRQLVTHDMASDAGSPALEGTLYSKDDFELEPCQWCGERNRLLEEKNG